jgi:hypothetical protein
MTEQSLSQQQWCGYVGGLLILPDAVHAPGRPYVHARLGSPRRTGGTPITVSACATL